MHRWRWVSAEKVEVQAQATILQTDSSQVGSSIKTKAVQDLPNFALPNSALGTSNFGTVSALNVFANPRQTQLPLKFLF